MKTENQKLIDKLDLKLNNVMAAIAELEDVKIEWDRSIGIKNLGRSFLYKSGGVVRNGLLLHPDNPYVVSTHSGFICWLDPGQEYNCIIIYTLDLAISRDLGGIKMLLMTTPQMFRPIAQANEIVSNIDSEDDWKYVVFDCGNGFGRVDVFDEDDNLIHSGF